VEQPVLLETVGEFLHVPQAGAPTITGSVWRPTASPTATVILIHGLQSHAGWFADAGPRLAARGLAVYAPDRRGSGDSPAPRGDISHFSDWFDDLAQVVGLARSEYPGAPIHLVGHCFGANLALGAVLRKHVAVSSIVMLTPGLAVLPGYTTREKLSIGLASLVAPDTRFRVPQDDDLFTRDPEVLTWISADSRGAKRVTARCLIQINDLLSELHQGLAQLDLPLLVLEASRDRLSDNGKNRQLLNAGLGSRVEWRTFDAEHFLLAEPCRDHVIDAISAWTTQGVQP
jgi:alpha-beta hydrolase superfamily lysophospholipase